MKRKTKVKLFSEEMDDEVLQRMPEWFKRLREANLKRKKSVVLVTHN